jgi:hypothetical protein
LQRVLVDFGAEHSFAKATERVREHYRIEVPVEAVRRYTLGHGVKVAGGWWKETNAQAMLNLRTARANNQWSQHWIAQN